MYPKSRLLMIALMLVLMAPFPAENTQTRSHTNEITGEGEYANVDLIGHIGGKIPEVVVQGDYAYIIEGGSLTILDIRDPEAILVAGRSDFFYKIDLSLEVLGNYAYVGDGTGLHIIDISNPTGVFETGFYNSPVSGLAVQEGYAFLSNGERLSVVDISDPTNPVEVGSYTSDALIEDLVVQGNYAYVNTYYLKIIDITDPTHPFEVGSIDLGERIENISVQGDYVYATTLYVMHVIDITDPLHPSEVGSYGPLGEYLLGAVGAHGDYACFATKDDMQVRRLHFIDVSDPTHPSETSVYTTPGMVVDLAFQGSFVIAVDLVSLWLIDGSDPYNPFEAGSYHAPGNATELAIAGDYAYVAEYSSFVKNGLHIVNISDPANLFEVGFFETNNDISDLAVQGSYAYLLDWQGLSVVDVSNPSNPFQASSLTLPDPEFFSLAIQENYAYVTDQIDVLHIIDISDPGAPFLATSLEKPGYSGCVVMQGDIAYLAGSQGLIVLDITDPVHPLELGSANEKVYEHCQGIAIQGGYAYVADSTFLHVVDISDPTDPFEVNLRDLVYSQVYGIAVSGDYAYLTSNIFNHLSVLDISDPEAEYYEEVGFFDAPSQPQEIALQESTIFATNYFAGLIALDYNQQTTLSIDDDPDPSLPGETITVTFSVSALHGSPPGTVTITTSGDPATCSAELVDGTGSCQIVLDAAGRYTLNAQYAGDEFYGPSSATALHSVFTHIYMTFLTQVGNIDLQAEESTYR